MRKTVEKANIVQKVCDVSFVKSKMKQVDNCLACNLFADLTKLRQCADEEPG
jgi:hypothetical protein